MEGIDKWWSRTETWGTMNCKQGGLEGWKGVGGSRKRGGEKPVGGAVEMDYSVKGRGGGHKQIANLFRNFGNHVGGGAPGKGLTCGERKEWVGQKSVWC